MEKETRKVLETHFTKDQIKQRKGSWGKTLDYIEGYTVIQRLNDAFDSDWSFTVVEHKILEDEVVVLGRLQVNGIVKEQFGSNQITRDAQTGKVLCLGENLKGAATDAVKKCASLLGVGLHLYGDVPSNGKTEQKAQALDQKPTIPTRNGNGNGDSVTPKQRKYILTLGRRSSLDADQVDQLCIENYAVPLDELSKSEASMLIEMLTA
ncbi:hypothetical protein JXA40_11635 [bacterium]|nr:hypothetical protein [candidate division CSSED10-310 bacterium]